MTDAQDITIPQPRLRTMMLAAAALMAGTAVLASIAVMIGWILNLPDVVQLHPTFAPMQFNTALCLFLVGAAMFCAMFKQPKWGAVLGVCTATIGFLSFVQYLFNVNLGIDELFMPGAILVETSHAGRMSPNTGICFVLCGCWFVGYWQRTLAMFHQLIAPMLCMFVTFFGVATLASYMVDTEFGYGGGALTRMAVHTAGCFALIGAAQMLTVWSEDSIREVRDRRWVWGTVTVSLALTFGVWVMASRAAEQEAIARFDSLTAEFSSEIEERLRISERFLRGGVALWNAKGQVTREDWSRYVGTLDLEEGFEGMQGFGFGRLIKAADVDAVVEETRAEGFGQFAITQEQTDGDILVPVYYIEPFDWRNRRAFGYDMYSNPVRREAFDKAIDLDEASMTGMITLVQETNDDVQPGFLLILPIFETDHLLLTAEDRRESCIGFSYGAFRMNDFVNAVLKQRGQNHFRQSGVRVEIMDGPHVRAEADLFDSEWRLPPQSSPIGTAFVTNEHEIHFAGHQWSLRFMSTPEFDNTINYDTASVAAVSCLIFGMLLAVMVWLLLATRAQVGHLAETAATQLRQSNTELQEQNSELQRIVKFAANDHASIASRVDAGQDLYESSRH